MSRTWSDSFGPRYDIRDHHMWWPALRIARDERGASTAEAILFADWFVANRWQDNVRDALDDYLTTQGATP